MASGKTKTLYTTQADSDILDVYEAYTPTGKPRLVLTVTYADESTRVVVVDPANGKVAFTADNAAVARASEPLQSPAGAEAGDSRRTKGSELIITRVSEDGIQYETSLSLVDSTRGAVIAEG